MKDFISQATDRTPKITGKANTGEIRIEGRSLPEDARVFYRPFQEWLLEILQSNISEINAEFCLEYFNTATSKILVDFMLTLDNSSAHKNISVIWEYDEDDKEMAEVGHDFKDMLGSIIQLKTKSR
ncbi:MAG: DUF1987 domain-containing protein [Crocinitomicaceae bacterium]|nr:DUF1987 domain-containing protein [Crocinitomicaceae bacterium]